MRVWTMILASIAGLLGAAGVGAAAAAAHLSSDTTLKTAADFLLFHAAALLGIVAITTGRPHRGLLVAGSFLATGTILFCGDLTIRSLLGLRLVPMAAPVGGMILIAGWLVTAVTAAMAVGTSNSRP